MNEQSGKFTAHYQVLLMFFIIIATLALGFFMMPSSQEERDQLLQRLGTTNHGTLLSPAKPIAQLPLTDDGNNTWLWSEHKPKWRMIIPAGKECGGECGELLFTTRQVHMRLGKFSHRFERVLVVTADEIDAGLAATIESTHPYLKVLHTDASQITGWLEETNSPWHEGQGKAILVDPLGVAMMVYDTNRSGNEILEDLNHLLKYSAQ